MNNLLLFEQERQTENSFLVTDPERVNHLKTVLDKKVGDTISTCLVNTGLAKGKILERNESSFLIQVQDFLPGKEFKVKLIVALSRPPTIKKIIEHGTSLGVSEFHFYKSELTGKSFLEAKIFKEGLFKKHLEFGLSQSKVFYKLPTVKTHSSLPTSTDFKSDQKYLLKMNAEKTFNQIPPDLNKEISLVLGPERGLTSTENTYFEEQGFRPVQVSPSTLRVEIACFAAVSQLFLFN